MITFNMLANRLVAYGTVTVPSKGKPRFSRTVFLDYACSSVDLSLFGETHSTLFCGNAEAIVKLFERIPKAFALCVAPAEAPLDRLEHHLGHTTVMKTELSPYATYLLVENFFASIREWCNRMKTALLNGGDFQSLINCSESMLENFIMVSSSEFRLLAYSQHKPVHDPIAQSIVEQGSFPQSTIELFRKYHVTKDWKTQNKIKLKPASELTASPVLDYVFRMQGSYYVHVLMHCDITPPSSGLSDTFQILIDHMESYVKRSWGEHMLCTQEPSRLFGDLIQRKPYGQRALETRLRGTGITATGNYTLYAFSFIAEQSEDQLLPFYTNRIKEAFPWCHVGIHGQYVLALDPQSKLLESKSQLQSLSNAHSCSIGVSNPFGHLNDFSFAFGQAKAAIDIATDQRQSLAAAYLDEHESPAHCFSDYFAAYVANVARNNNQLVTYCAERGVVARIAAFDKQRGSEDLKLLFFYLAHERKVSPTCEALFLHRNTLLYHIDRLQKTFGFDLDDLHTRQQIMLEFLLIDPS